jgi:TonB family protein
MKSLLLIPLLMLTGSNFAQTAAPPSRPLTQVELIALLATGTSSERIAKLVGVRGIDFIPDAGFLKSLQDDRAGDELLTAVKSAKVRQEEASATDPEKAAKDSAALAHLHRAAQSNLFYLDRSEAELEFREAVTADPENPFVHLAWGEGLSRTGKFDAAISEFRIALKLQPDLSDAHVRLGNILLKDPTQHLEAKEEFKQAVTLDPSDALAHIEYATALDANGDKEGAAEQRKIADGLGGSPAPRLVRVSGQVMASRLISRPPPDYPLEARAARIEGTVRMEVIIDRGGAVEDIAVISGDPILAKAAVTAVKKWRYQPTLIKGQPVEVILEVDLAFNPR